MKLGAENSKKTILAIVLFAFALILIARMFFGGGSSGTASVNVGAPANVPPAPRRTITGRRPGHLPRQASKTQPPTAATSTLDPRLRLNELKEAERTDYTGKGRNIFLAQASEPVDIPKIITTPIKPQPAPQPVYTPPPPPPIDLKFFGFASTEGVKRVFLSRGDDVFVASEGEIVNRRYKIVKINANNIEVLDMLSNNQQTIPLTAS